MKFISVFLSALMVFMNSASAYAGDIGFWSDRKKEIHTAQGRAVQLALLPSAFIEGSRNLAGLPHQFGVSEADLPSYPNMRGVQILDKFPPEIASYLKSIPQTCGALRDFHLAPSSSPNSKPLVIVIQDVHLNLEAQQNIASILSALNHRHAVLAQPRPLLVGIEGAFGPFQFDGFRAFLDKQLLKAVSSYFLKEKRFAGPHFMEITASDPPAALSGIDDKAHYASNVAAYASAQSLKKQAMSGLTADLQRSIREKAVSLNRDLKRFDDEQTAYQTNSIGLGDYVAFLAKSAEDNGAGPGGARIGVGTIPRGLPHGKDLGFPKGP
jgi:hypothetical protein